MFAVNMRGQDSIEGALCDKANDGIVLYLAPITTADSCTSFVTSTKLCQTFVASSKPLNRGGVSGRLQTHRAEPELYGITSHCPKCQAGLRVTVSATEQAIRTLQVLFVDELAFVCRGCSGKHGGRP